jgi:hypothetical protein
MSQEYGSPSATIPALTDNADITQAFKDYHDDISGFLNLKAPLAAPTFTGLVTFSGTVSLPANSVASSNIVDGTIVNSDISTSAAIAQSKIDGLATSFAAKAPLADPTFSGTVSATNLTVSGTLTAPILSTIQASIATLKNTIDYSTSTATSYTPTLTDAGKMIGIGNASAITVTVPTDVAVAFPVNSRIDLLQTGAGQITVSPASGVTLNSKGNKTKIFGQWSAATLIKISANTWALVGDLA